MKWVSTKDRYPKDPNSYYIVTVKNLEDKNVFVMSAQFRPARLAANGKNSFYTTNRNYHPEDINEDGYFKVTHWICFPEPYKK